MKRGFSLIELLIVVAIIGILAAIGIIGYNKYIEHVKRAATEANAQYIYNAIIAEDIKENICSSNDVIHQCAGAIYTSSNMRNAYGYGYGVTGRLPLVATDHPCREDALDNNSEQRYQKYSIQTLIDSTFNLAKEALIGDSVITLVGNQTALFPAGTSFFINSNGNGIKSYIVTTAPEFTNGSSKISINTPLNQAYTAGTSVIQRIPTWVSFDPFNPDDPYSKTNLNDINVKKEIPLSSNYPGSINVIMTNHILRIVACVVESGKVIASPNSPPLKQLNNFIDN